MTVENIEQAYDSMYKSVEMYQKIMHYSFYQAYFDNLTAIISNYELPEYIVSNATKEDLTELKGLYEQLESTPLTNEERRKVTQLVLLKGSTIEPLQPNHQLTPDSIGFLMVYLMEQLTKNKEINILDPAVGSGNLLATALLNTGNGEIKSSGVGVDIDDTLLEIADTNAEWCDLPVKFYHQDAMQPLLIEPTDFVISDLPIGYYPIDDKAKDFKVASDTEHTYAHHLIMEASMKYLKNNGFALFLVPGNLLTSNQANELKKWLNEDVYLQAIIQLPETMFKNKAGQKNIIILQNRNDQTKQAEVLAASLLSLTDKFELQNFLNEFDEWKEKEFI